MSSGKLFGSIISNTGLWGAIISTLLITFLGFVLFKTKILNDNATTAIQKIIINIIIPFLSFFSFMKNADKADLKTYGIVFGLSAIYYIILTTIAILWTKFLPHLIPKRIIKRAQKDFEEYQANVEFDIKQIWNQGAYLEKLQRKHLVTWLMCIYGSNILFATPIVLGVFPNGPELGSLSIWNILYYIGGFGLSFSLLSGVKFTKKEFKYTLKKAILNPAFIVVLIAIGLWATQYIPRFGSTIKDTNKILLNSGGNSNIFTKEGTFGPNFSTLYGQEITVLDGLKTKKIINWFRYDNLKKLWFPYNGKPTGWFDWNVTMPYLAKPVNILVSLISPLIWIVIGTSLAKTNLKEMFRKKENWLFLFYKSGLVPLFILLIVMFFVTKKLLPVSVGAVLVMVGAVPPGTTIVLYSQHFKNHDKYTSQVSSLSTMSSFIFIPTWLVVGELVLSKIAQ
ncbi:malate permease [Metamycoplasma phocicerebrale]|uniref:Malate permease n=1 Tax=Metamycoplasma phocicerebrale TaxID=142649 RepID=A0A3Q9VBL7_9BACT|nr:AEC family transporter [Metamycoplasma phocicerebrale]AZZ65604.1 malate permease [Metamycoplasma phocicerebrale]